MIPLKSSSKSLENVVNKAFNPISKKIDNLSNYTSPIVYHGTFAEFEKFDKSFLGTSTGAPSAFEGFFFASNPKVASSYASDLNKRRLNLFNKADDAREKIKELTNDSWLNAIYKVYHHKYDSDVEKRVLELLDIINESEDLESGLDDFPIAYDSELDESGFLKKVKLHFKNPFVYDMKGEEYRDISYKELIIKVKSEGYDGLIIKNTYDGGDPLGSLELTDIYVAFDESQIEEV